MTAMRDQRLQAAQPLLLDIWQALASSLEKEGLAPLGYAGSAPMRAELREDTYDQNHSLFMEWRTPAGDYLGSVVVHGNGQSYAEFDVLLPHPHKPAWVVEAVVAWGSLGALKSELRLLPALSE